MLGYQHNEGAQSLHRFDGFSNAFVMQREMIYRIIHLYTLLIT